MRVNTKVVSSIETGEILERESYEYSGPIESCDPVTLGVIASIVGIAGTGTEVGLSLANQPGTPKPPTTTPAVPTPAQAAQTAEAQKAAVSQQLPTIEGLTSGYANPGYYSQQGALAAGTAGQPGGSASAMAAVEKAFGLPPGTLTGGGGGTPSTANFKPAGVGDTGQGAFPTGTTDLSNFVNTFFKG